MQRFLAISLRIRPRAFLSNDTIVSFCAKNIRSCNRRWICDKRNLRPTTPILYNLFTNHNQLQFSVGRMLSSSLSDKDVKKAIESLTDKFMEARELLDDARESEGTVYFSDDMDEAKEAVRETIDMYSSLLKELSEEQRQDVVRTIGLKMEELKAQLQAIEQDLKESH